MTEKEYYEELKDKMKIVSDNYGWARSSVQTILDNIFHGLNINGESYKKSDMNSMNDKIVSSERDMDNIVLKTIQQHIDESE